MIHFSNERSHDEPPYPEPHRPCTGEMGPPVLRDGIRVEPLDGVFAEVAEHHEYTYTNLAVTGAETGILPIQDVPHSSAIGPDRTEREMV